MKILEDFADIAIKIAQYRQANDSYIPHFIWNECRTLFLKNQSIFGDFNEIDEMEDEEETENLKEIGNKIETTINENKIKNETDLRIEEECQAEEKQRRQHRVKLEHRKALVDMDFENYRDLAAPWDEFVPEREEEIKEISRLGRIVLGYVVHRLLEILYPLPIQVATCPVPKVKVAAIILGITNPKMHEQLRELLQGSGIRLLRMEDAINHCLESYKQEMSHIEYIDVNIVSATTDVKEMKSKMNDPKEHRLKRIEKTTPQPDVTTEEKQTQTPRRIPYDDMDPILSDAACTGREKLF